MTDFSRLLAPGRIGAMELRNRIIMCPMGDSIANDDGTVSDRQVAYYEARARGGVGLVIVGSVGVAYPAGSYSPRQTAASRASDVPGLARLATAVHRHGGRIAAQLVHDAANSRFDIQQGLPLLVSSPPKRSRPDELSAMVTADEAAKMTAPMRLAPTPISVEVATEEQIAQAIEWFADAAERCVEAGFDAIELHAGHGYLIDWFLSPSKNSRTDAWGGDLSGRARFLCEIVRAVRSRVGSGVPVWMRLNARESHTEGGTVLADALGTITLAEQAGIDAVHMSAYGDPMVAVSITEGNTPHEPGLLVQFAEAAKGHTSLPVITFGRLEPEDAEKVLADGRADFVSMGRKLLADPDLPRKLAEGRRDDVRPCIYQYRCIGNIFVLDGIECVANAATAHGDEDAPPVAASPRTILVVGGGPAGLEAARLLASGGHRVSLVERSGELGGRLLIAGRCDPVLEQMRRWLVGQVEKLGVDLHLGVDLVDVDVAALAPDVVIDATGTTWPGLDPLAEWVADESRGGRELVGDRVALLGGDKPSLSLASLLRSRGRDVTVAEPSGVFGQALGLPGRHRVVHELREDGVGLVSEISPDELLRFDTVVDVRRATPTPIDVAGPVVHRVGDVTGSAGLEAAFRAAREIARDLAAPR